MGRRRKKGRPVTGWLVLDKPYDYGSTEAVSKLRWLFAANKCGHAGTLDPLATGILPIAFGEATKTAQLIQDGEKRYRFTARWGEATSTDDREGDVIERSDVRPTRDAIEAVLPQFTGLIQQVPPAFSAVKVDGERAYDLARDGEAVELEARPIDIHELILAEMPDEDTAVFEAVTGKGAYVRALVRDIAKAVGTCGHVTSLRRTAVGPFTEDDAVTFEDLQGAPVSENIDRATLDQSALDEHLIPLAEALSFLPSVTIAPGDAAKLRRGQAVILAPAVGAGVRAGESGVIGPMVAIDTSSAEAVALCDLDGLALRPTRVFVAA